MIETKNSIENYTQSSGGASFNNNKKTALLFLSANNYAMDIPVATVAQQNTKSAMENLYRMTAFFAVSQIIIEMSISYQKTSTYWSLLQKLEASIDMEDSAVYTAVENIRLTVSLALSSRTLSTEAIRQFSVPLPLLYIAQYLRCDEEKLRELNSIADSFIINGDVVYA